MTIYENRKNKNKYYDFIIQQIGAMYGRDDIGPYVCTMRFDNRFRFGQNAMLLLWRLDMSGRRGWFQIWESSDTTKAIVEKVWRINAERKAAGGRMIRFIPLQRYTKPNDLAEVQHHKHNVVFK